ncbi:MAG: hypothetical protein KatS3mg102_1952 [Planctomycetota bacterium]|nr:MAG: hypothetical protein KatS3mg102_1952 [Planctomycetota bacterium]
MRVTRRIRTAAAAVFAAAALGAVAWAEQAPKEGDAAPEIEAAKWYNVDKPPTLAALKDKVVVVEFWATWCPPCRRSIPHLNELHGKYKDKGLVVIGLSNEDPDADKVKAFIQENIESGKKMTYAVGFGSETARKYGVRGIPTAFIVVGGKITWSGHPLDPRFENAIEKALQARTAG